VTQEHVESQLSAMFDGELPTAECELLSRRIDRDEHLRARWARYALIGAAMRSEPVATASAGFARGVSAAIDAEDRGEQNRPEQHSSLSADDVAARLQPQQPVPFPITRRRSLRTLRSSMLAASIVAAVAGVSIGMLRYSTPSVRGVASNEGARVNGMSPALAGFGASSIPAGPAVAAGSRMMSQAVSEGLRVVTSVSNGEPRSYVTPVNAGVGPNGVGLRTELADFIVAHSEYSAPLMRRSLLSTLVSSEEAAEAPVPRIGAAALAGQTDAAPAASAAGR
jgi:negative regulator of sigma E activity